MCKEGRKKNAAEDALHEHAGGTSEKKKEEILRQLKPMLRQGQLRRKGRKCFEELRPLR